MKDPKELYQEMKVVDQRLNISWLVQQSIVATIMGHALCKNMLFYHGNGDDRGSSCTFTHVKVSVFAYNDIVD